MWNATDQGAPRHRRAGARLACLAKSSLDRFPHGLSDTPVTCAGRGPTQLRITCLHGPDRRDAPEGNRALMAHAANKAATDGAELQIARPVSR